MHTKSRLVLPPRTLASCLAVCIVRDTRGVTLSDVDRLNYFPASPLFSVTLTLQGHIHVGEKIRDVNALKAVPPAGKWLVEPPKDQPFTSWCPGPIFAMTLGFYPDAWWRLGGTLSGELPAPMVSALTHLETEMAKDAWPAFWNDMSAIWKEAEGTEWTGSHLLKDWTRHLAVRLAQSAPGRGLRTKQRLLQRWTGQTRKTLDNFAKVDELHRLSQADPDAAPAQIAADAGFSDQSHMGRALKRVTGFSPVQLNQRVASDEAFWCYRLLGERF